MTFLSCNEKNHSIIASPNWKGLKFVLLCLSSWRSCFQKPPNCPPPRSSYRTTTACFRIPNFNAHTLQWRREPVIYLLFSQWMQGFGSFWLCLLPAEKFNQVIKLLWASIFHLSNDQEIRLIFKISSNTQILILCYAFHYV